MPKEMILPLLCTAWMAATSAQQQPVIYVSNLSATDNNDSGGYYQVTVLPPMIPQDESSIHPVVMPYIEPSSINQE